MVETTTLPSIDLIIVTLYLLGTAAFGAWFIKRNKTMEAYVLGSRRLPGWAIGISILGTYLSSISFWPTQENPSPVTGIRLFSL